MSTAKTSRIFYLDALRGVCILGMVFVHLMFDLDYFIGLNTESGVVFGIVKDYGGILFVLISGVCVTLGRHNVRRGIEVLVCGLLVSAVTAAMFLLGMADEYIIIYFGILHLLGACMILWSLFSHFPLWLLLTVSVLMVTAGYYISATVLTVRCPYLFPLGLVTPLFSSSDYFPLLPNLGWFLLGAFVGKAFYRSKKPLCPHLDSLCASNPVLRFFCFTGRHSLVIYLAHQPVIYLFLQGYAALCLGK